MTKTETGAVKAALNMYAETGRYLQKLPTRRQREAEKLGKHFADCERIFLWTKGEEQ